MNVTAKLLGSLSILLVGCNPAEQSPATRTHHLTAPPTNAVLVADTSRQYLYDFMRDVVADQHLARSQAVAAMPLERLDASESDTLYLPTLRSDRTNYKNWRDSMMYAGPYAAAFIPRCLTRVDVDTMLRQKQRTASLRWNRARLGFGQVKGSNFYRFSVPLFAKNNTLALLTIEDLCPGLCGTGRQVLFVKEGGRWKSKARSLPWYH